MNGIFPEADNVQNEIDVILRKGRSITFISCKMTDLSVEAINELEVYANHFAGESCLKLIVVVRGKSILFMPMPPGIRRAGH